MSSLFIKKFFYFFSKNLLPIVFSILVGIISFAPQYLAVRALGSNYQGVPFMFADDEDLYLGRIQEIIDGHLMLGSPYFYEYKDWPVLLPPLNELIYAAPSFLFSISPEKVLVASKFLGPALLFLLIYGLIMTLTVESNADNYIRKITAIVTGLLVTLGYDFVDFRFAWSVLNGSLQSLNLLIWTRPVNPIIGALSIFSFFLLIYQIIRNHAVYWSILAGILLGFMVGYFFSWGAALAFVILIGLLFAIRPELRHLSKFMAYIVFISFLVSIPYWYRTFQQVIYSPDGRSLAEKNGMYFTHALIFNKFVIISFILFILISLFHFYKKKEIKTLLNAPWWIFSLALIITSFLVFNQQVITGRTIWPYHFVQYTIPMSMVAILVIGFYCVRPYFSKFWNIFLLFIGVLSIIYGLLSAGSYIYKIQEYRGIQKNQALFSWLRLNGGSKCVVLVNEDDVEPVTRSIPAFTQCDTYTMPWIFTGIPNDRVYYNFLVRLRLQNVDSNIINTYLSKNPSLIRGNFFTNWDQMFGRVSDDWQEPIKQKIVQDYPEFVKNDFAKELKKYRLDYLVSRTKSVETQFSSSSIKLIEHTGEWYIYKIF